MNYRNKELKIWSYPPRTKYCTNPKINWEKNLRT